MHPAKHPVSQESVDEEDEQVFEEEAQAQLAIGKKGKGKGKGKKSIVKGPFKSGPIPDQAKEHAFAIHANFKKQIQDLAAEIRKAPQLLFSLVGEGPLLSCHALTRWGTFEAWYGVHGEIKKSKNNWNRIVTAECDKFCKDNLGDKWEDPEALTELFEPIMTWHLEKYETYMEELKLEGTFNKVIGKVQHEFVRLPDHISRTGSAMWGATPAFERMKIDEKGVISRQIMKWETLLRRADMALNSEAKEQEKELWTVQIMGDKRDHAHQAFLAWLGRDIEDMECEIDDPDLKEVALVLSTACGHLITVEDSVKFTKELAESNGLPAGKSLKQKGALRKRVKCGNAILPCNLYDYPEDPNHAESSKAPA
ncbi:hypothetical protein DXG01_007620 [Tephrocybe rancida]|nr:hypothetical protein DXG01_007620 [Tephrocybe rancida]